MLGSFINLKILSARSQDPSSSLVHDLTVVSLSEAAASMGFMFAPADVSNEEEEEATGTPGQTRLMLSSLLVPQGGKVLLQSRI
jgi:hypothetical protein